MLTPAISRERSREQVCYTSSGVVPGAIHWWYDDDYRRAQNQIQCGDSAIKFLGSLKESYAAACRQATHGGRIKKYVLLIAPAWQGMSLGHASATEAALLLDVILC